MPFSSELFVFYYLPFALVGYYVCPGRFRLLLLVLVSYAYYAWAGPSSIGVLLASTLAAYIGGRVLRHSPRGAAPTERRRRLAVAGSVAANLALLGRLKYAGLVTGALSGLWRALGGGAVRVTEVAVPLGCSLYALQSISYVVDLYRGRVSGPVSFLDCAGYLALFPKLVAGPLVRYHEAADQMRQRQHSIARFGLGVFFFAFGLGKKVLLADPMGEAASAAFAAGQLGCYHAWLGILGYAFQLYFDWSGYCDMAVGIALALGFSLPRNFKHPYRADSLAEFWRRWNSQLTTWLREYLYEPLGANRLGVVRTVANIGTVTVLGGLWHGTKGTFALWGAIHGVLLLAERWVMKRKVYRRLPRPVRVGATFLLVLVAWVVFRAPDLAAAGAYLGTLFSVGSKSQVLLAALLTSSYHLAVLIACAIVVWLCPDTWELARRVTPCKAVLAAAILVCSGAVILSNPLSPFLYGGL